MRPAAVAARSPVQTHSKLAIIAHYNRGAIMHENLVHLKARLTKLKRLSEIAELLGWDQQTYMPECAAASRGEQSATLSQLIHDAFVSAETGDLLNAAEQEIA